MTDEEHDCYDTRVQYVLVLRNLWQDILRTFRNDRDKQGDEPDSSSFLRKKVGGHLHANE
jgi:hypothetical protein